MQLLEQLATQDHSLSIGDWGTGGKIYYDYMTLRRQVLQSSPDQFVSLADVHLVLSGVLPVRYITVATCCIPCLWYWANVTCDILFAIVCDGLVGCMAVDPLGVSRHITIRLSVLLNVRSVLMRVLTMTTVSWHHSSTFTSSVHLRRLALTCWVCSLVQQLSFEAPWHISCTPALLSIHSLERSTLGPSVVNGAKVMNGGWWWTPNALLQCSTGEVL